jgi:hypothetical protein
VLSDWSITDGDQYSGVLRVLQALHFEDEQSVPGNKVLDIKVCSVYCTKFLAHGWDIISIVDSIFSDTSINHIGSYYIILFVCYA